jgi:uncharacterized membrane protein
VCKICIDFKYTFYVSAKYVTICWLKTDIVKRENFRHDRFQNSFTKVGNMLIKYLPTAFNSRFTDYKQVLGAMYLLLARHINSHLW